MSVNTSMPNGPPHGGVDAAPALSRGTPLSLALESSRPIALNINFARITGDAKAAVFLSQLVYWTRRGTEVLANDGWIFKTREQWEAETGLTRHEQLSVQNRLIELGLIESLRTGAPARNCYRVVASVLGSRLAQLVKAEPVQWSLIDIQQGDNHVRAMLGRQFAFYRLLSDITSSTTSAIYLSRAIAIQQRFGAENTNLPWDAQWFRMAIDSTRLDTGLTPAQQRESKHKLCQLGFLEEAVLTHPRKQHFLRVNFSVLIQAITGFLNKPNRIANLDKTGKWFGPNHYPEVSERNRSENSKPQLASKDGSGMCVSLTHYPEVSERNGSENSKPQLASKDGSGMCVSLTHYPEVSAIKAKANPTISSGPNQITECENRTTRNADLSRLDVRFSQPRRPVLAPPSSDFHTQNRSFFGQFPNTYARTTHAQRLQGDYKQNTTTTTPIPLQPSVDAALSSRPAPPQVVVVVEKEPEKPRPNSSDQACGALDSLPLIWPSDLDAQSQASALRILAPIAKTGQLEDTQNLVDEWAGCLMTYRVTSPLAYLRRLVTSHLSSPGGLVWEKALDVQQMRQAQKERLQRLALLESQQQSAKTIKPATSLVNEPHAGLSAVAKANIDKTRALLGRSHSAKTNTGHPSSNPAGEPL